MRADGVVVLPPTLDEHLGFEHGVEQLAVEQFVTKLAVETFDVAVLPRISGSMNNVCTPTRSSQSRTL